jgi:hypothetical protein
MGYRVLRYNFTDVPGERTASFFRFKSIQANNQQKKIRKQSLASYLLFGLFLDLEDGASTFLQKVGGALLGYTESHLRRQKYSEQMVTYYNNINSH